MRESDMSRSAIRSPACPPLLRNDYFKRKQEERKKRREQSSQAE